MMRWSAIVGLPVALSLLTGCPHSGAAVAPAAAAVAATPVAPAPSPVSFELYDKRISDLLPVTTDADQRDRLQALRSLLQTMRQRDPAAQAVVRDYVAAVLAIEERTQPVSMSPEDVEPVAIAVEALDAGPDGDALLAEARDLLAQARYDDVLTRVASIPPGSSAAVEGAAVQKEAIDAWARERREQAGVAFLAARELEPGPERTAAIESVRRSLVEINQRFPGNAYAEQIRENVARVDAELAAIGATP